MKLDPRPRAFLLAIYLAILPAFTHGQQHAATITGTLYEADPQQEECRFVMEPSGDSEAISIVGTPQGYLCDFLRGTHHVTITITPEAK